MKLLYVLMKNGDFFYTPKSYNKGWRIYTSKKRAENALRGFQDGGETDATIVTFKPETTGNPDE